MIDLTSKVLDVNPSDQPIVETHYFKWLQSRGQDVHAIHSKREYLETVFNYRSGETRISQEAALALRVIERYYAVQTQMEA